MHSDIKTITKDKFPAVYKCFIFTFRLRLFYGVGKKYIIFFYTYYAELNRKFNFTGKWCMYVVLT